MTYLELENFLKKVDTSFPTPLSKRVSLSDYATKLLDKSTLVYKKNAKGEVIALLAGYTNHLENNTAYMTLLGVQSEYKRQGLAMELLHDFFSICKSKNIDAVHLYTDQRNESALALYQKIGFHHYVIKNEPRQIDVHLIYHLKN